MLRKVVRWGVVASLGAALCAVPAAPAAPAASAGQLARTWPTPQPSPTDCIPPHCPPLVPRPGTSPTDFCRPPHCPMLPPPVPPRPRPKCPPYCPDFPPYCRAHECPPEWWWTFPMGIVDMPEPPTGSSEDWQDWPDGFADG